MSKVSSVVTKPSSEVSISSIPTTAMIIDDEYAKKMEEQKRKREQILRMKEEKRNQRIKEAKHDVSTDAKPAQQQENIQIPPVKDLRSVIVSTKTSPIALSKSSSKRVVSSSSSSSAPLNAANKTLMSINKTLQGNDDTKQQHLVIKNLSTQTSEKNIANMCNSISLKDKVKYQIIN